MKNLYRLCIFLLTVLEIPVAQAVDPPTQQIELSQVHLDEGKLRAHFIDVGAGLASLIETPGGKHIMIDGGDSGLDELMTYLSSFVPVESEIDIAIVTHPHRDHYLGMQKVFNTYNVNQFWYTGYTSLLILFPTTLWQRFLDDVEGEKGCDQYFPIKDYVEVGERQVIDEGQLHGREDDVIIHYLNIDKKTPKKDSFSGRSFDEAKRRNNSSLVFKIVYGNTSFLFTGDINGRNEDLTGEQTDYEIDSEELELWIRHKLYESHDPIRYNLKSTVLQAAHHGSNGSSSLPFLQAVGPDWVVVSAGTIPGYPHEDAIRRMKRAGVGPTHILRTDKGKNPDNAEPDGDDSYIFEVDLSGITKIWWVKL